MCRQNSTDTARQQRQAIRKYLGGELSAMLREIGSSLVRDRVPSDRQLLARLFNYLSLTKLLVALTSAASVPASMAE